MQKFYRKRNVRDESDPFAVLKIYIPVETLAYLKKISLHLNKPMSRLACIAIDNEMDVEKPFNYPINMPKTEYVQGLHLTNAIALLDFIKLSPKGISTESILLCRNAFGIPDRNQVMEAYRELLNSGLIEEYESKLTNDDSILVKAVEKGNSKKIKDASKYVKRIREDEK